MERELSDYERTWNNLMEKQKSFSRKNHMIPKVSIIIPVYNGGNYVAEAIESALSQTYKNIEVIVVNDGSDDQGKTEEIALSYGKRIRYFYKENGGVSSALNIAIKNMKGEYFSWLSHDDLYHKDKIKCEIELLAESDDKTKIVFSDFNILYQDENRVRAMIHSKSFPISMLNNSLFPIFESLIHGCSLLIHKSLFDKFGLFDETLIATQDYQLWFHLFRGREHLYCNKTLVTGRVHSAQVSVQKRELCRKEENDFFINIMSSLTKDEIEMMYGSEYNFYERMWKKYHFRGAKQAAEYAFKQFIISTPPKNIKESQRMLQQYFQDTLQLNKKKLVIFGAGLYGKILCDALMSRGIVVTAFVDNNRDKVGTTIFYDIPCISYENLKNNRTNYFIIIAILSFESIAATFDNDNITDYTTYHTVQKEILKTPAMRNVKLKIE